MKIMTVNCLVRVRTGTDDQSFWNEVYRCKDRTVAVTEIPILETMNGHGTVTMISPEGWIETTSRDEWDRLHRIYDKDVIAMVYPGPRSQMPTTLDHLDIEQSQIATVAPFAAPVEEPFEVPGDSLEALQAGAPADEKAVLRAEIEKITGEKLPFGNFGVAKLRAMRDAAVKAAA